MVIFSIIAVISINLIFDFRIGVLLEFLICLIVVILPSILFNFLDKFFPKKWYSENNKIFNERKFERKFYEKIGLKRWKNNVPQFLKIDDINKTKEKVDKEYLEHFISETRRGEFMHFIDILFAYIAAIFLPWRFFLRYTLPILVVWTIFNLISIWIQRYNRPRLKKALERVEREAAREKERELAKV